MIGLLALAALAGSGAPAESATYRVGAVLGSADRVLTTESTIAVERVRGRRWTFAITRSSASVEGRENWMFDSAQPRPTDPWPVTQMATIGRVSAEILLDKAGRPVGLADVAGWEDRSRAALADLKLPGEADTGGAALLDADGLLEAYQRDFPGRPPKGSWTRIETVLDVPAQRIEDCAQEEAGDRITWRCEGTLTGTATVDGGTTTIEDGKTSTILVFDDVGLLSAESRWDATIRTVQGAEERARPVVGRRLLVREPADAADI